jgi:hypothetical protein
LPEAALAGIRDHIDRSIAGLSPGQDDVPQAMPEDNPPAPEPTPEPQPDNQVSGTEQESVTVPQGYKEDDPNTWAWPHKYRSYEDVVEAKKASDTEAINMSQALTQSTQAVANMQQRLTALENGGSVNPATTPQAPQKSQAEVLAEQIESEYGIRKDLLLELVGAAAAEKTVNVVDELFKPARNQVAGAQAMHSKLGDEWVKTEQALHNFIGSKPELQNRFNKLLTADAESAYEWAYSQWQVGQAEKAVEMASAEATNRVTAQDVAKQHAGIPKRSQRPAGPSPTPADDRADEARLKKLLESDMDAGRSGGMEGQWFRERLKDVPSIRHHPGSNILREQYGE